MAASTAFQVLALGSPHGDDQVAWKVADKLAGDKAVSARGLQVHKLASPFELPGYLKTGRPTIIIDACRCGSPVGTVVRFDDGCWDELPATYSSTHGGTVRDALRLAEALDARPAVLVVLAVEIDSAEPGRALTHSGRQSVESLEQRLRAELARW